MVGEGQGGLRARGEDEIGLGLDPRPAHVVSCHPRLWPELCQQREEEEEVSDVASMEPYLIVGICFLCYEVCDLIRRYSAPPIIELEASLGSMSPETSTSSVSFATSEIYSISQKLEKTPSCCSQ